MATYAEALNIVLNNVHPLGIEEKTLEEAQGQVLAEDIYSDYNLPQRDTSGPDGYAVRSPDIEFTDKEHPAVLQIIETVRAGYLPQRIVLPGTAIRIMTGSIVPDEADCVVRFEDTDEPGNKSGPNKDNPLKVNIFLSLKPGANIIKAGINIKKGGLVMTQGKALGPAQLSLLTTLGKTSVKVHRRPVIAIISTGDELIEPGEPLVPGKSINCNTGALKALIKHYGGTPRVSGIARDTEESLTTTILSALTADAIITSGGVSKGDYDLVRLVSQKIGKLHLARINMGPGASFAFGECYAKREGKVITVPLFGLSGPPAGCLINFETLFRPALLKMLGHTQTDHPRVEAVAEDAFPGKRPINFVSWTHLKMVDNQYRVTFSHSSLGPFASMINANSLTIVPENESVRAGDKIKVMPLDWSLT